MDRMKTFGKYLIIFVLFYLFVDFASYIMLKNTYKNINYILVQENPKVEIIESKATFVNGYIKGTVKNTTGKRIEQIFMKIDLYSDRDVILGTKYVKIDYFNTNQTKEFLASYKLHDVSYYKVSFTTEDMTEEMKIENEKMQETIEYWLPFVSLVLIITRL